MVVNEFAPAEMSVPAASGTVVARTRGAVEVRERADGESAEEPAGDEDGDDDPFAEVIAREPEVVGDGGEGRH